MVSFPRALVGAIGIGIGQALFRYNYPAQTGAVDALLFLVVLVAVLFLSRRAAGSDEASFSFAPRVKPIPERLREIWWVRQLPRLLGARRRCSWRSRCPFLVTAPSRHFLYSRVLILAIGGDLARGADGLGRPGVARPDGLRRVRRPGHRRPRPRQRPRARASAASASTSRSREFTFPSALAIVDAGLRAPRRRSSAPAPCACAASTSPS